MSNYVQPLHSGGLSITYLVAAAVVGGQLVEFKGDYLIGPATRGTAKVAGVAAFDAAPGDHLTVHTSGVHLLPVDVAIAAGVRVAAGTDGLTVTATGTHSIGITLKDAAAGGSAEVRLD